MTDPTIRTALLAAAAADYAAAQAADPADVRPSPAYERWAERLRRDPLALRRRGRGRQLLHTAACFALVAALVLGTVLAASPTARAWAARWIDRWEEGHVSYVFQGDAADDGPGTWSLGVLPEGYREVERIDLGALVSVLYDGPGGTLELSCQLLRAGGTERLDDSRHDAVDVTVGGWPGRLFVPRDGGTAMLLWCDETHSFLLLGPLPGEDLLSLAEGVTETTETTE